MRNFIYMLMQLDYKCNSLFTSVGNNKTFFVVVIIIIISIAIYSKSIKSVKISTKLNYFTRSKMCKMMVK